MRTYSRNLTLFAAILVHEKLALFKDINWSLNCVKTQKWPDKYIST